MTDFLGPPEGGPGYPPLFSDQIFLKFSDLAKFGSGRLRRPENFGVLRIQNSDFLGQIGDFDNFWARRRREKYVFFDTPNRDF